jgi:hypothetical protein
LRSKDVSVKEPADVIKNIPPSGRAAEASVAPVIPDEPGRLTITIGAGKAAFDEAANARPKLSVPPPAEYGTIKLIGLLGFHSANAAVEDIASTVEQRVVFKNNLRSIIVFLFKSIRYFSRN